MRRIVALKITVAAALMLICGAARAEKIENVMYKAWVKFKPGSTSTIAASSDIAGQTTKTETKTTLKEVGDDKVTIELVVSMDMGGNKMEMPAQSIVLQKMVDGPAAGPATKESKDAKVETKTAEESVTVKAGTFKAKIVENTSEHAGTKIKTKAWMSDDVPGGTVKTEVSGEGAMKMESKGELIAMEKK